MKCEMKISYANTYVNEPMYLPFHFTISQVITNKISSMVKGM
jgi:hypothetical protein